MGTLKKAEIEAIPNIEFILIYIASMSRREPSGDFPKILDPVEMSTLKCF